jgi:allantoate deiminase
MIANEMPLDGDRIVARLKTLAEHTDVPGTLTRLTGSPAHGAALRMLEGWFREAGLQTRIDRAGSLRGRWAGRTPDAATLYLGSHIDSVRDGGIYDGDLGVMLGLAVAEDLARRNRRLPFAVEVVAFGDEEGVRYPTTMTGSRALAGTLDPAAFDEVDDDGIRRRDAFAALGIDVRGAEGEAIDPARTIGFVEVHIEQGPVLEAENLALGVVTAIQGTTRGRVTVTGMAGHAGTLPMEMRRDALVAASLMITEVERTALSTDALRATVGRVEVVNGSTNVVPGLVTFSLDVRSHDDTRRAAGFADITKRCRAIAAARGVTMTVEQTYNAPAAPCDERFRAGLRAAIERAGERPFELASGAGHDAMSFKDVVPQAMLFVRCRDGISHNPAEYSTPEDIGLASRVLADFVASLDDARA